MATTLQAVNRMLRSIGEPPVTALDTNGTTIEAEAETIIDETRSTILAEGWRFNTEDEYEITIPTVKIAVSGGSGTFTYGETVTESTSGATGTFDHEESGFMYLRLVSGTFTGGETLTGGTSAATRTGAAYTAITSSKLSSNADNWLKVEPWRPTEWVRFVVRGDFLYDIDDQTTTFDKTLHAKIVRLVALDQLSNTLADYLIAEATIEFQRYKKRGSFDEQVAAFRARRLRTLARQEDWDLRDTTIFNTAEAHGIRGGRRDGPVNALFNQTGGGGVI